MTAKFLKQSQEIKKSIVPTTQEERANRKIRGESCYTDVTKTFPNLDECHRAVLAKVVKKVFYRADDKGAGYTPFKVTPENSVTHPQAMVDWLCSQGAEMVPLENNKSTRISINSMSDLTEISKGTFASVNSGNQHLTKHALEKWRKALAAIGSHNESIESVHAYSSLGQPLNFLYNMLEEWRDLVSTLPLVRIAEWAQEYSGLTEEQIEKEVEEYRPTHQEFLHSMVKVWRDEYEQGRLENYLDKATLLDVMKTRTASRRIGRAFDTMISTVHDDMSPFNSRLKYPKTHFIEYKRRYGRKGVETGLTSDVLMGYCMFLGINPIAMLNWLAYQETKTPGTWEAESANTPRDVIKWKGTMHPEEYRRFHKAIHRMGLVSDQNRWALDLLSVEWVYRNLPDYDAAKAALFANAMNMDTVLQELPKYRSLASQIELKDTRCSTVIEAALACEVNLFNAHRDALCLSLMSVGELTYHLNYAHSEAKQTAEEKVRDSFETLDAFSEYMNDHICKVCDYSSSDVEDYMDVELDEDGKVVIADSYQAADTSGQAESRANTATTNFYKSLVDYLKDRN